MAQSIVSREELLENAYQIAERNGVSALSVRGLANATGVSVGTVYRHFSAKDELTTATIQLYFKHAFYERFCHIDPQVGFVDYCREMHASMREVTTHFRECWLRGIDALPAVEKAAARLRESQQIEHISTASCKSTSTTPGSRPICPTGSMQKACAGSSSRTSWAASITKTATAKCCLAC